MGGRSKRVGRVGKRALTGARVYVDNVNLQSLAIYKLKDSYILLKSFLNA